MVVLALHFLRAGGQLEACATSSPEDMSETEKEGKQVN